MFVFIAAGAALVIGVVVAIVGIGVRLIRHVVDALQDI